MSITDRENRIDVSLPSDEDLHAHQYEFFTYGSKVEQALIQLVLLSARLGNEQAARSTC
ncbi:hypothetical protein IH992_18905 [Candidatus Poribacteria bacterium]|nr:hypothetical protein [Candidatus Poribacteria bacterium]